MRLTAYTHVAAEPEEPVSETAAEEVKQLLVK